MLYFNWDDKKNDINIKKHGISFEEAKEIFYDEDAILIEDKSHSDEEERFILLGINFTGSTLVVVHCYRTLADELEVIRIISARKATKKEERDYWKGL